MPSSSVVFRLYFIAFLTVVAVVACDRMPLTSPTGSTISISIDKDTLPINGQTTVRAIVIESGGTFVHNGTIVTFQPSIGRTDPVEAQTVNGVATATFLAGTVSGSGVIHAFSGAARTGSGNSSPGGAIVKIGTAGAARVTVRTEPLTIPVSGGTVSVIASVFDASGNPIINTPITITSDFGSLGANTATTDANGEARVQLTTNRTTSITARAGEVSGTFTVTALSPPSVQITGCTASPTVGVPVNCTVSATSVSSNSSSPVPIVNVTVNWGDGTGEQPLGPITGPTVVSHIYANPGSYQLTAAATDANSQRGTAITSLNVIRVLPTIQITGPTTGTAGTAVSFTVTPPTNPSIPTTNVTVDFGDGTSRNLGAITASQSVVKVYNSPGFYTVAATITDQTNQHNTATTGIQITAGTGPTVTFTHDTAPANANVAEVFTVNAFSGTNGISNVSVRLQDGTLVYSGPPGSFTWTPTNAHIGTQTMTAVATDGAGNTSTRILQITINP